MAPPTITHIHEINDTMSSDRVAALTAAGTTAPELNNRALQLSRMGNHDAAIAAHLKALQIKVAAYGMKSIQAGLTLNALGEEYLATGDLEQAEEALKMSRTAREMNGNNDFDSAVTRENLARVYERTGDWAKARSVRVDGGDCVACSNWKVSLFRPKRERMMMTDENSVLVRLLNIHR